MVTLGLLRFTCIALICPQLLQFHRADGFIERFQNIGTYKYTLLASALLSSSTLLAGLSYYYSYQQDTIIENELADEIGYLKQELEKKNRSEGHQLVLTATGRLGVEQFVIDWYQFYKNLEDKKLSRELMRLFDNHSTCILAAFFLGSAGALAAAASSQEWQRH